MEIILSHTNTDFDGLASMVAVKRLYPEAEMVYSGKLARNVQEFMALHRDSLEIRMAKDIPLEKITKIILVDTRAKNRIGIFHQVLDSGKVEVHVYDHHPKHPEDLQGTVDVHELVGATTTLLVEMIHQRGIMLTAFEATILALGIYEDTGCLTFPTTTARDAEAVAYLLNHGANLALVADFIGRPLTEAQKNLLNVLILSAKHYLINGVKVLITQTNIDEYVGGLALLTHKLGDIEGLDVIIAVVQMEDRVHIVARSRVDSVDVQALVTPFGGGGHAKAASASVRDGNIEQIVGELHKVLNNQIKPINTAAQLMSAPVKIVAPTTTIDEAGKIMLRYGHTGLPVVDNGELVGVISRRDLDKAKHHGLGHAPVKGYMSRNVITVEPETPLRELQRLLIENNIGRLPVLQQGKIIGIVSRTDILKCLHGENYPEKHKTIYLPGPDDNNGLRRTIQDIMRERLPEGIRELLGKVSFIAHENAIQVYVVGGFVRDLLLGVENLDVDLVVEGDGVAFARLLANFLNGDVRIHEKFGTAVVIMPDNFRIDVVTARTEYYEYPAALPTVELSSIKQDLYRRDFTINAMAIDLSEDNFGQLIDYFGGRKDLDQKVIRVLYNLSFVEDPTRLFRAIRFEQRFNFSMESQTLALAKRAIKDKWLDRLSYDRIREELRHIFNEAYPLNAINRMRELGLWKFILPEIDVDAEIRAMVDKLPEINDCVQSKLTGQETFHPWLVYFMTMIHRVEIHQVNAICQRLRMNKEEAGIIQTTLANWPKTVSNLEKLCSANTPLSLVARELAELPAEAYAFISVKSRNRLVAEEICRYLQVGKGLQLAINGEDIKAMGYAPGPIFKEVLEYVRAVVLDGGAPTRAQQLELLHNYLQEIERM